MDLLIYSYIADLIFGDPECLPHPVRLMGRLITFLEKHLGKKSGFLRERVKGVFLWALVVGATGFLTYGILKFSKEINPFFGSFVWVYLGYTVLAVKDLRVKAKAVLAEIENGSIKKARFMLSKVVGRDTQDLEEAGIVKAVIESVAESINDGIVAPFFYLILGGPVLAMVYKSVNTLDSMVGYKNEKYRNFGWFSAKSDDCLNYIPARVTGVLITVASGLYNRNFLSSFKIMTRDGQKHLSPNSGISEAAMAGALGVRLGGTSKYFGKIVEKPYIGDENNSIKNFYICEALNISLIVSFLMLLGG
ncbi:MAG: adenosylcobinamide-phosphate synthase CbiB, partial [Candidatus Omnitrophica bacterium]|nr:adenosylcobinamide-phosphate synthase CbiB [Candidatus Omnitrophota bacterium]